MITLRGPTGLTELRRGDILMCNPTYQQTWFQRGENILEFENGGTKMRLPVAPVNYDKHAAFVGALAGFNVQMLHGIDDTVRYQFV